MKSKDIDFNKGGEEPLPGPEIRVMAQGKSYVFDAVKYKPCVYGELLAIVPKKFDNDSIDEDIDSVAVGHFCGSWAYRITS